MPLSDGNPFVLARLAPGVAYHGDLKFSRPFDNGGTSDFTADGGPGRNEFTLDGSPNMANGRRVAFVPPAGAVQEFKVETATFDAQQGHTAGATVNVTLKSGTNKIKGDAAPLPRRGALGQRLLPGTRWPAQGRHGLHYGFNAGGPVFLGKADDRNKTFFFTGWEWLYDTFPEPGPFTVPTEAQRNGDFSALLSQGIVIYDPLTAVRRADGRIERQPFPNNVIPSGRISPIAREYLKYWPTANQAGTATGLNNYFSSNPRGDDFYSMNYRVDHVLTEKQRFFVRYSRNNRVENRGNWTGEVNSILPTGNFLYRINDAVNVDHVWTMSSTSLLNMRASWSRFQAQHPAAPGDLRSVLARVPLVRDPVFRRQQMLSRASSSTTTRSAISGDSFSGGTNASIYSFQPTWTLIRGSHSFRSGGDFRAYREEVVPERPLGRPLRLRPRQQLALHQAAGQLGGRGDRPGSRRHAARLSERRPHRPQHRSLQPGDLRWRLLPGRLEGEQQADPEPRPPLGVRRAPTERDNRNVRGWNPDANSRSRRPRRPPMRAIRSRRFRPARSACAAG